MVQLIAPDLLQRLKNLWIVFEMLRQRVEDMIPKIDKALAYHCMVHIDGSMLAIGVTL